MSKEEMLLSEDDVVIIKTAIEIAKRDNIKIWDQEILNPVKRKMKGFMIALLEERCCYCCKNITGEHSIVLDIEHILPKAFFKQFEFTPFNLSVACKRCNIGIKGQKRSFLHDETKAHNTPEDSENYKFIHPNFDKYFDHLEYEVNIKNSQKMLKYSVQNDSSKGKYTYSFFRLKDLEIDSFNAAQGVKVEAKKFSGMMPQDIIHEIQVLLGGSIQS